jgi:MFS family permease
MAQAMQTAAETAGRTAPLAGARAALVLLVAINLFNYLDRQVLAAVISKVRSDQPGGLPSGPIANGILDWLQDHVGFRAENALLGSMMTAFMVSYMVMAPVFGWLAERTRRWAIVGIAVIIWSLASGYSGLATTIEILFLTRCLVGIGEAAYGPVAPAMISDLYPAERRGRVLSWFYMAIPVGSALGYVLGGATFELTGSWRWPFYIVVLPGIALGVLAFLRPEPPRGQADLGHARSAPRARLRDWLVLFKTPSWVLCTLGMTAMTFALGGIAFWMPDYIHVDCRAGELGRVNFIFGAIVVVAGLTATLLGGLAGDWLRKYTGGSYFLVSAAGMLAGFPLFLCVLYTDFEPYPVAWVFVFLACFALFFNTGPTNTVLANVTHPSIRATAFALNIFIIHAFGDAISPLIIGAIKDRYDLKTGFLVVSGMIFVAGLLWLWGARYLERDAALAVKRLAGVS